MVKILQFRKCITLFIIILFIGVNIIPATGFITISQNCKSLLKTSDCNPSTSNTHGWIQIIGDYPNGEINNGFNNSYNVAVRGKTNYIIDDKEYLFLGTGNLLDSPFGMDMINTVLIKLKQIFIGWQHQFILNLLINIIENYFKRVASQGCELWYYDGSVWRASVGNNPGNTLIGRGFNNANNSELTMLIPFTPPSKNITYLYAGTWNPREGCEIWRTDDPINGSWQPIIVKNN
jgi:hypothetical protein